MKTRCIVVADDPVFQGWLQRAAGVTAEFSLLRPLDAEDLLSRVDELGGVDLAMFEFGHESAAARAALVERLVERYPGCMVVGLGASDAPQVVLTAMRAGARDFFVLRRDDEQLPDLLARLLRRSAGGGGRAPGQRPGRVFGVLAAAPTEGVAFLAEHLALAMLPQLAEGERALLIDLSSPAGAAAVFLNLSPTYNVIDALHDVYRCDQTLVDSAFARHDSGLYLLGLPEEQVGRPEYAGSEFAKLLEVLRGLFALIVVAVDGHAQRGALPAVVALAERSLMLSDQSILRSRQNKYLLRSLRQQDCPLDRMCLAVDTCQRRTDLDAAHLAGLLDLPLAATLTGQPAVHTQAKNSGEPLSRLAPREPYWREVERVARLLFQGRMPGAPAPRRLFAWRSR